MTKRIPLNVKQILVLGALSTVLLVPKHAYADTKEMKSSQTNSQNVVHTLDEDYSPTEGPGCDDMYVLMLYQQQTDVKEMQQDNSKDDKKSEDKKSDNNKTENKKEDKAKSQETKTETSKEENKEEKAEPQAPSDTSVNNRIVNIGKQFLGTPYVWGGTTPAGFDCSGFTQYVVKQATGIDITRTSSSQPYSGTMHRIPLSEARPGDLVYDIGSHTGIFISDEGSYLNILHSPKPGDVVKIGHYHRNVSVYRLNY
ncbi:C40 family peptidase [Paraclostridium bifermentans]|uniref:C40 family peptidase n=1 Tax=Paraclostridium bifermentans TaxID=1490 RepID=UPI00374E9DBA